MKKVRLIALALSFVAVTGLRAQTMLPYQNPNLSAQERAEDLCSRLTLQEKAQVMMDVSKPVKRLGIPHFDWWNEALHGVGRNGYATVFPITMGMASSWNEGLVNRVFDAVSDELRAKNNDARSKGNLARYRGVSIWTPNINIFRDPRWGRGQETYGEDPYLTTQMGLAVVRGLQGPADSKYYKTLACAKHFAVHSGPEWNRHTFDIQQLPERDLWETYLPAFKSLVQEGNVREVMCAYQRIDGDPCCGNNRYLQQILRNEWGFNGLVVSDCGAVSDFWKPGHHEVVKDAKESSAKAVISGTDIECGSDYKNLPDAVAAGLISEEQVNMSVVRLLKARFEVGDFDSDELVSWRSIPQSVIASKEHKALALEAAEQAIVMMQNRNNLLPLKKDAKVAVVGPNAKNVVMLWGNYSGYPTENKSILDGITAKGTNVKFVDGSGYTRNEAVTSRFPEIFTADGEQGMKGTYWNNTELEGEPVATAVYHEPINLSNGGATVFAPGVELENFSARYEGIFRPTRTEKVNFEISADDRMRIIVAGDTIVDVWKSRERVQFGKKEVSVEAGKEYPVVVEFMQGVAYAELKFDANVKTQSSPEEIARQAADCDVVLFIGGISPQLEGEEMKVSEPGFKGGDRTSIELPQAQRDVIAALAKAGKKIVFVNCSGSAVALTPEAERCDAILQAWYGGEKGGEALANVIYGDVNPSGKLPITFYKSDADLPDFLDYTMKNRTYRYFTGEPLWAFGHGLSYTSFDISAPKYNAKKGELTMNVKNTGNCDGAEVAQVYIRRIADAEGPQKTLRAYQRINIRAGETKNVCIHLPRESFECWDAASNTMRVIPGKYEVMVGNASDDVNMKKITIKL